MKTRNVIGQAGLLAVAMLALAMVPTWARQEPAQPKEQRRAGVQSRRSAEEFKLWRRKAGLELQILNAKVEAKKAEIAQVEAEFEIAKVAPDLAILTFLDRPIPMHFAGGVSLEDLFKHIRRDAPPIPEFPDGLPIYIDPVGLDEAGKTMASTVSIDLEGLPLRSTFRLALGQLGLTYIVRDGLLTVTSRESADEPIAEEPLR